MYIIKPSVRSLTEDEVRTALNSKDEENLIVIEFSLMLRSMVETGRKYQKSRGSLADLLATRPSCAMEKIALEMIADMIAIERPPGAGAKEKEKADEYCDPQ